MFKRIKNIILANGNDLLDKLEEPKKILRQSIRNMEKQKFILGKKIIELNAKLKYLDNKNQLMNDEEKEFYNNNISKLKEAYEKMMTNYAHIDKKIKEYKSKVEILEVRAITVKTSQDIKNILFEIDYNLDDSTFKRMEEKIALMEYKFEAEQELLDI